MPDLSNSKPGDWVRVNGTAIPRRITRATKSQVFTKFTNHHGIECETGYWRKDGRLVGESSSWSYTYAHPLTPEEALALFNDDAKRAYVVKVREALEARRDTRFSDAVKIATALGLPAFVPATLP